MDPLKRFSSSVRTLWKRTTQRAETRSIRNPDSTSNSVADPSATGVISPQTSMRQRLQSRLAALKHWDPSRARTLFVETVVLHEFGNAAGSDSNLNSLVQHVSAQLGAEDMLSARLDQLLRSIRDDAPTV